MPRTPATSERAGKVQALAERAGTEGGQQAAQAALLRIGNSKPPALRTPLSDALVRRLSLPERGNRITWDGAVGGFGVRVTAAGAKAFILDYRIKGSGRQRRLTIGGFPNWSTTGARAKAREWRRLVDDGGDPLADLDAQRDAPAMPELIERFRREHLPRKSERTRQDYSSMLDRYIAPHFGVMKVAEVTFADVDRLHRNISDRGYAYRANCVHAVVRKMLSLAVHWQMRADNPARGIERNKEYHRRRYLDDAELTALLQALEGYPDRRIADALFVLLHTGARRGEVLAMRWSDVDLDRALWSKPPSSTKQREHHQLPLSEPVIRVLRAIQQQSLGEFVFPGSGERGHVVEIKKAWRRICKNAGLVNARIHDLRHTHASVLVSAGYSLPMVGSLLGHSTPSTTARYAHLAVTPQRQAVEQFADIVSAAESSTPLKRGA